MRAHSCESESESERDENDSRYLNWAVRQQQPVAGYTISAHEQRSRFFMPSLWLWLLLWLRLRLVRFERMCGRAYKRALWAENLSHIRRTIAEKLTNVRAQISIGESEKSHHKMDSKLTSDRRLLASVLFATLAVGKYDARPIESCLNETMNENHRLIVRRDCILG